MKLERRVSWTVKKLADVFGWNVQFPRIWLSSKKLFLGKDAPELLKSRFISYLIIKIVHNYC